METLKNRIVKLLDTLNERVYGKEEVMALALLSAVAGESIFLLGPPGVAKSMVARRLKLMFRGRFTSTPRLPPLSITPCRKRY